MDGSAIDWMTDRVLAALGRDEPIDAPSLTFLLRRYCETDREDLGDALGPALARAVEGQVTAHAADDRAAWLMLFSESAAVSADRRLRAAASDLVDALRQDWGHAQQVDVAASSVDACLRASSLFDPRELVPPAIDELERIVGGAYRPGGGVAHVVNEPKGLRGCLGDHVRSSSALLTAYELTGLLPYSMLAEELMQCVRGTLWDDERGGFFESLDRSHKPFVLNCDAARVLCRLAALHRDDEYRKAAVVAADADYGGDAACILTSHAGVYRDHGLLSAAYGIALAEWLGRPW